MSASLEEDLRAGTERTDANKTVVISRDETRQQEKTTVSFIVPAVIDAQLDWLIEAISQSCRRE